jgi:hypothetical protein
MFTGTHISAALFIPIAIGTPPVVLPETPDFVERELVRRRGGSLSAREAEEELETRGQRVPMAIGREKGRGTRGVYNISITLSKYFAHSYRLIRPVQLLCLTVKDVPP